MEQITLKKLCEETGISRRSIQRYEEAGLMHPAGRNKYRYLLYDRKTVERAEKIRFFQQMGFRLREIGEILDAPADVLKDALERRIEVLEQEREQQKRLIVRAYQMLETLEKRV